MELNGGTKFEVRIAAELGTQTERVRPMLPQLDDRRALQREPDAAPIMYQTWRNLCFLHWEWDAAEIHALLPPGLFVDLHGSRAYVAVTPFFMEDVRASFLPEIPGASDFLELNVRTYVHDRNGVPGVWFFSLDCNHSLAVLLAKAFYSLPYCSADMEARETAYLIEYRCHRRGERGRSEFFYRREPKPVTAQPGSLPFFLTERYLLYSFSKSAGRIFRARVHHAPWQLLQAHLGKFDETMLRLNNLNPRLRPPDHAWFAEPVRVQIYSLESVD